MFAVRTEAEDDLEAVRRVHEAAFETPAEADLVDALRSTDAWVPELSLVAEHETGGVAAHLLLTIAALDREERSAIVDRASTGPGALTGTNVLALAPMAVIPERQRAGMGGALVREGLARAVRASYPMVVVVGHPGYYRRFGFRPARAQGIECPFEVPDDAWMALPLPAHQPDMRGTVVYAPPFADV